MCIFNVDAITVGGRLTVNGNAPVLKTVAVDGYDCTQYTNRIGRLIFRNLSSNAEVTTTIQCASPAAYSIALVAGSYEVRLSNGGGANVPGPDSIVAANLVLGTSTTAQNFNVNALTVGGRLTVNNAAPVLKTVAVDGYDCSQYTNRIGRLIFKNLSSNAEVTTTIQCASPAAYSLALVAGSYEVRLSNGGGANVPGPDSIVAANLVLGSSTTTQNFNVNAITVGGQLTVNGSAPVLKTVAVDGYDCSQYTNRIGRLIFKNLSSNAEVTTTIQCASPAAYSLALVAGSYEVRLSNGGGANVPGPDNIVASNLVLGSSTTTQNFNVNALAVGGRLTVNNAAPVLKTVAVDGYDCSQYTNRIARLIFRNLSSNAEVTTTIQCASPAAYSIALVAGSYEVRLSNGGGANVPGPDSIVAANLVLGSSTTTQNFNVNAITVGGQLTVNGSAPVLKTVAIDGYDCTQYTNRIGRLIFRNLSSNAEVTTTIQCASPAPYSIALVAGSYEVRLANGGGANVPGPDTIVASNLMLGSTTTTQHFNVNAITVTGNFTVNGAPPVLKTVAIDGYDCSQYTNRIGRLTFKNLSSNAEVTTTIQCASPAAFSIALVSGIYEIRFSNGGGANAPGPDAIIATAMQF